MSVGIPTYNRPAYLRQTLADIAGQTYRHLEIIVADNGSPGDDTEHVVREFMATDPRIRFTRHSVPITAFENFRYVFEQASGPYFMWASDDDRHDPRFVELLVKILEDHPECSLAFSEPHIVGNPHADPEVILRSPMETVGLGRLAALRTVLLHQNLNTEVYGLFRRRALADVGWPRFYAADHAWLVHAALKGEIRKGPPGLLTVRLGGIGNSADGVVRATGLPPTIWNRYFGYVAQAFALGHYLWGHPALGRLERWGVVPIMIQRTLLTNIYRPAIIADVRRLLKHSLQRVWTIVWWRARPLLRLIDFARVCFRYVRFVDRHRPPSEQGPVLTVVSLEGMNHFMAVIWSMVLHGLRWYGYRPSALTLSESSENNRYYRLFRIPCVYWDLEVEAYRGSDACAEALRALHARLGTLRSFQDFHDFGIGEFALGKYGISTYCREQARGVIDVDDPAQRQGLVSTIEATYVHYLCAKRYLERHQIDVAFFTELNTQSYGGVFRALFERDANVVRWASSSRDNAYFLQHFTPDFHSWHHAALAPSTWEQIRRRPFTEEQNRELDDFFRRRYGGQWRIMARNYKGTGDYDPQELRRTLGLEPERPAAIIYSHILYDTLYFYGRDLFENYAEWFVETVRSACANTRVTWFVKLHPSNVWRAEHRPGEFEEEVLLRERVGALPEHVRLIAPSTPVGPMSWMQLADFGITARGTVGLEMACMGKTVLTAGWGRYEGQGFTVDSDSRGEYLQRLADLPDVERPSPRVRELARQYTHAVFCRKTFEMFCVDVELRTGARDVRQYNDLLVVPSRRVAGVHPRDWPDVRALASWLPDREAHDFINDWSDECRDAGTVETGRR